MGGIVTPVLLLLSAGIIALRFTKADPLLWFRRWREQRAVEHEMDAWHHRDRP